MNDACEPNSPPRPFAVGRFSAIPRVRLVAVEQFDRLAEGPPLRAPSEVRDALRSFFELKDSKRTADFATSVPASFGPHSPTAMAQVARLRAIPSVPSVKRCGGRVAKQHLAQQCNVIRVRGPRCEQFRGHLCDPLAKGDAMVLLNLGFYDGHRMVGEFRLFKCYTEPRKIQHAFSVHLPVLLYYQSLSKELLAKQDVFERTKES